LFETAGDYILENEKYTLILQSTDEDFAVLLESGVFPVDENNGRITMIDKATEGYTVTVHKYLNGDIENPNPAVGAVMQLTGEGVKFRADQADTNSGMELYGGNKKVWPAESETKPEDITGDSIRWTVTAGKLIRFTDLSPGNYVLTELTPPGGFSKADDIHFKIDSFGRLIVETNFLNRPVGKLFYESGEVIFDRDLQIRVDSPVDVYAQYNCITEGTNRKYTWYTPAQDAQSKCYTVPPIMLTGGVPFATEEMTGGFRNVPASTLGRGYIHLNGDGHLQLVDYDVLRQGTLAYQLGEDVTIAAGLDAETIQQTLDEFVNCRVAFANDRHLRTPNTLPNVIKIRIPLTRAENGMQQEIVIRGIDSRFNTSVWIDIQGNADSNTTVRITDCARVRILPNFNANNCPAFTVENSCLYYNTGVFNHINQLYSAAGDLPLMPQSLRRKGGFRNVSLWYERYSELDPNIGVFGNTVRTLEPPTTSNVSQNIDLYSDENPNDNKFSYDLRSITIDGNGDIASASIMVQSHVTANVSEGDSVLTNRFSLPQNKVGLSYPENCLTRPIIIHGQFVNAYHTLNANSEPCYMMSDIKFSAITQDKNRPSQAGSITFYLNNKLVRAANITVAPPDSMTAEHLVDSMFPGHWSEFQGYAV